MSTVNPVEVIAEALAKHAPGETFRARSRETGERATVTRCTCGSVVPDFAAHQASVIAALPSIAIVQVPAMADGDTLMPPETLMQRIKSDGAMFQVGFQAAIEENAAAGGES